MVHGTERKQNNANIMQYFLEANTVKAKIKITIKNKILICLIGELILMIRLDLKKLIF